MKIAPFTIYAIGVSAAIIPLGFGYISNVMPNKAETELNRQVLEQINMEASKQRAADERVQKAIAMVRTSALEWQQLTSNRVPAQSVAGGGISLAVNPFQLTEDTRKFRNNIQRTVNAQVKRGGIEVVNGPTVPGVDINAPANSLLASFYNYPAIPFPVVIFDLGTVTVRGTREQIMAHMRAYKQMPNYFAVTDGLRLDGTSPNLTATYNLSIVGYIQSPTISPRAPEGQGASNQGAGGGAGGPGMMGGPGGGPGIMGGPGGGRAPAGGGMAPSLEGATPSG
jgi:hypothetical protein